MSAYSTTLHDEDNNEIYPKTLAENVYDGNTRMDQKVDGIRTDLGNPSSASAVTGADAFSKISKLNSDLADLNNFGKTVAFSESVICPAYVSATGNYVSFVVPLNVVASKTYTVTVSDISFFKPTGGRLVWANDFDQSYKDVRKLAAGGLKIELKFSSTQSSFIQYPAVVTFSGSIAVS